MIKFLLLPLILLSNFVYGQDSTTDTDSLDIKIGQMIMIGFNGTSLKDEDPIINEIKQGSVSGVVFFEKNIAESNSEIKLKQLTYGLQTLAPIPLFLAIDQEGGIVNRLKVKYGFPKSVTAAYLGELDNEDSTRFYAQLTAANLAGLGLNVNFAPVLDLASNPDNPIIARYGRAYSANPHIVAKNAGITIEEHKHFKVISVGKHFPGHGSSHGDTHLDMTDVTDTWNENELFPYDTLNKAGQLPAIMSAHIVNNNLDPEGLPGTLSKKILQGVLRKKLGFEGVVFSDDMQMHAITKYFGLEKSIELGINAGLDVIIYSNNIPNSEERTVKVVHDILRKLIETKKIPMSRINESYNRIMRLKKAYLYE